MPRILACVGMCGSGKTIACDELKRLGWQYIRFGQITIDRLIQEGKVINPENEKVMRERLRKEHGMGAFAALNISRIEQALTAGPVVIDGLYSWSEYKILKERFGDNFFVLCIYAAPRVRYQRLSARIHDEEDREHRMRQLTSAEALRRDYAEIENIEKGGPIAMADFTIINHGKVVDLITRVHEIISKEL